MATMANFLKMGREKAWLGSSEGMPRRRRDTKISATTQLTP